MAAASLSASSVTRPAWSALSGSRKTSVCVSFKAVLIGFTWFRL
jgi:hypothetical protein